MEISTTSPTCSRYSAFAGVIEHRRAAASRNDRASRVLPGRDAPPASKIASLKADLMLSMDTLLLLFSVTDALMIPPSLTPATTGARRNPRPGHRAVPS